MQGNPDVIAYLNTLLAGELAARDQYFIHSRMYDDWGYKRLHERSHHEMEEETGHASVLIARILLLGGTPAMKAEPVNVGEDVPSMFKSDLAVELKVRDGLKQGIALCEQKQDYVSRNLLLDQLKDTEEDHAHWLEQQLSLIEQMGIQNYLQSQTS
ncbi:bacterioferritin [Ottowia testudinis]|uniref:Bacterioferritin n=1 Tax=Ottowia testudinis TaxID=2816950 RepID=A0A975CDN2_9BURK|nr:bacterioferritin [Ottowia testudinis]QTD44335.1 bacterioferritin [Ottowia testudinis]